MGQHHDEGKGTPDGATTPDDGGPGRGASGRSGSDGNAATRDPARFLDTRSGHSGTRGPDPLGGFVRRLLVAMVTVAVTAGGAVLAPDLLDGPITLPPGPFTPPTGHAEEPSVFDELGPGHGLFSGLVPSWDDLQRAASENRSSAPTQDADPATQDADTLVAEQTEESDDSVTVDIDSIRNEMHEVEVPVESESEAGPEPESDDESESGPGDGDDADSDAVPGDEDDADIESVLDEMQEDDLPVDDDGDAPGDEANAPDEWCSRITHLLPGAGEGFASGVWVWTHETRLEGRWVWVAEEPGHPCFADDTVAGIQPAQSHDAFMFVWAYGEARAASDVEGLLRLVHPAIRGLFGDDSCRELLGHSPWAVVATEATDIGEIQPWHFEYETGVVSFPDAVSVGVHHVLHDDGEMTIPFTLPIVAGSVYLAVDCDHRTP